MKETSPFCAWSIWAGAVAMCMVLLTVLAYAHDHNNPSLNDWFKGLKSHGGFPCCDGSDAVHVSDPDWKSEDGHYAVKLDGEWIVVPDNAVIDEPNLAGPALVWPVKGYNGTWIRCFMPGTMG